MLGLEVEENEEMESKEAGIDDLVDDDSRMVAAKSLRRWTSILIAGSIKSPTRQAPP
jgi:hypothetical protein